MKLVLRFSRNNFPNGFQRNEILITGGRVREYNGYEYSAGFITNDIPYKHIKLNAEYKLVYISRYDRKLEKVDANYKLEANGLRSRTVFDTYVKLNPFQKFILDWGRKDSFLHKEGIISKWVVFLFFALPIAAILLWLGLK